MRQDVCMPLCRCAALDLELKPCGVACGSCSAGSGSESPWRWWCENPAACQRRGLWLAVERPVKPLGVVRVELGLLRLWALVAGSGGRGVAVIWRCALEHGGGAGVACGAKVAMRQCVKTSMCLSVFVSGGSPGPLRWLLGLALRSGAWPA